MASQVWVVNNFGGAASCGKIESAIGQITQFGVIGDVDYLGKKGVLRIVSGTNIHNREVYDFECQVASGTLDGQFPTGVMSFVHTNPHFLAGPSSGFYISNGRSNNGDDGYDIFSR